MFKNRIVRLATVLVLGATPLGVTVAAQAAGGPAPGTGATGACNMVFTHGGTELNLGMQNAMSRDNASGNASGNAGMVHAVDVSGCS